MNRWWREHCSILRVLGTDWSVVQPLTCVDSMTPWTVVRQPSLSFSVSQSLLRLMSTESVMPSKHLVLCCPLPLLPSIFPSIRVFSNKSAPYIRSDQLLRWRQYWNFGISPSNGIQCWFPLGLTGLISLLSKGLSRVFSNTTVRKHQFFSTQPSFWSNSFPYVTTGKNI